MDGTLPMGDIPFLWHRRDASVNLSPFGLPCAPQEDVASAVHAKGVRALITRRVGGTIAISLLTAAGLWGAVGLYDYAYTLNFEFPVTSPMPTVMDALLGRAQPFDLSLRLGAVACVLAVASLLALHEARHARSLQCREEDASVISRGDATQAPRESQERYRMTIEGILEHMPMGAFAKDPSDDYRYLIWNQQMEVFDGRSREEVLGRTDFEIYDRSRAEASRRIDDRCLRDGEVVDICEGLAQEGDSGRRVGHLVEFPVKDDKGERAVVFGLVKDMTEQRRLEDQLHQSQKMEALGLLAGGVAHDFNNVLQVISGYAELLHRDAPDGAKDQQYAKGILDSVHRSMTLVRQLLSFSRREGFSPEVVDPNRLVQDLLKMLYRVIGEHIELIVHPGINIGRIKVDPGQFEQVLLNLCINSRDAMPNGGKLIIETRRLLVDAASSRLHAGLKPGQYMQLSVSDTGEGIPRQLQERVFEPFFTTKGKRHGTGLGLATVYAIVERHGGAIHLYSEKGRGTSFRIYLPSDLSLASVPPHPEPEPAAVASVRQGATILLAEDDDSVRNLAAEILSSVGYHMLTAADGVEAVERFRAADGVDLLIIDVLMPRQNGRETYEQIAAEAPDVPVLFCSGYSDDVLRSDYMLQISRGSLLQKPYGKRELLSKVNELFAHPADAGHVAESVVV